MTPESSDPSKAAIKKGCGYSPTKNKARMYYLYKGYLTPPYLLLHLNTNRSFRLHETHHFAKMLISNHYKTVNCYQFVITRRSAQW